VVLGNFSPPLWVETEKVILERMGKSSLIFMYHYFRLDMKNTCTIFSQNIFKGIYLFLAVVPVKLVVV
jgi:hypothetical protein